MLLITEYKPFIKSKSTASANSRMGLFSCPLAFITIPIAMLVITFVTLMVLGVIGYIIYMLQFRRKDKNYKGQHVLIFGGSAGMGQAVAFRLAKQGATITVASRSEEKLKQTKEECERLNPDCVCDYSVCDITKLEDIKRTLNKAFEKKTPTLIINSAGIAHPAFINDLSYETYQQDMDLNFYGILRIIKEGKVLIENANIKEDIDFVHIGSICGLIGFAVGLPYITHLQDNRLHIICVIKVCSEGSHRHTETRVYWNQSPFPLLCTNQRRNPRIRY